MVEALKRRWPTAIGLLAAGLCLFLLVRFGFRAEFGPGVATMAGIYLAAYAIGRPRAAWSAFLVLGAVVAAIAVTGVHPGIGMSAVLVVLWLWATFAGRHKDGRLYALQTAGMVVFGLITIAAALVEPRLGGVLAGVGWLAHGGWDAYHFARNQVVNRPWSEMCAVTDIPVGTAIIVASLIA